MSGMSSSNGTAALESAAGTVFPDDPRYQELTVGFNQRCVGAPDYVRLAGSTAEVVRAVQEAVDTGRRLSVVSGGHCLAPFVFNDEIDAVIDLSGLAGVSFDRHRGAFAVGAGARLGAVYETLYKQWGVTLPGGMCPTVGVGGHVTGGGYGFLSRQFGAVVDHLEAVEVVVVDGSGTAYAVIAGRDPGDPNHELWWMCAGGGGGSVGIVTRFLFRSAGAGGTDPAGLLPAPPKDVLFSAVGIPWTALDRDAFDRLVRNWCGWYDAAHRPGRPRHRPVRRGLADPPRERHRLPADPGRRDPAGGRGAAGGLPRDGDRRARRRGGARGPARGPAALAALGEADRRGHPVLREPDPARRVQVGLPEALVRQRAGRRHVRRPDPARTSPTRPARSPWPA